MTLKLAPRKFFISFEDNLGNKINPKNMTFDERTDVICAVISLMNKCYKEENPDEES